MNNPNPVMGNPMMFPGGGMPGMPGMPGGGMFPGKMPGVPGAPAGDSNSKNPMDYMYMKMGMWNNFLSQ